MAAVASLASTVTDRLVLLIDTVNAAEVVGLKFASPALVAVIEQVPVPDTTWSLPLTIEHAVDAPALKDNAPVPEPPLVVMVASGSPYVADVGPVTVSVAWLALAIVTAKGA